MNKCDIFTSFTNTDRIWRAADRLSAEAPQLFHNAGLLLDLQGDDYEERADQDIISSSAAYSYKLLLSKSRHHRALILAFEMYRPVNDPQWEYARTSLLTCAYSPAYKNRWELDMLLIDENGHPVHEDTREGSCIYPHVPELIIWKTDQSSDPIQPYGPLDATDWFFSVPLSQITSQRDFVKKIVQPCASLLKGDTPSTALAGTGAIQFNNW
ncbi:hypothetical protein [Komagataeibacter europaeus]|uniref:hypothetical protein n=1 Tax=Komagataeibacter europaeus TaxID=33995 RepID=UPI000B550CD8|nr:hypothetical protein [Komagataeibacter europaeus]ARW15960.1 hypothetical protein S101446_00820 [Komagataeibacter europaeus]